MRVAKESHMLSEIDVECAYVEQRKAFAIKVIKSVIIHFGN